jgi:hypothetical protein
MPFVGELDGEIVTPEEVEDDARLTCLECGDDLSVRRTHERDGDFIARHFWHPKGAEGCAGGESETHRRVKSVALSKAKRIFPYDEAGLERKIGYNIADVYLEFKNHHEKFGDGVVIEVQHKNEDKQKERITVDYLRQGYSVCWISTDDIDGMDIEISGLDWSYAGGHYLNSDDGKAKPNAVEDMKQPPLPGESPLCLNCSYEPELVPVEREHVYESGQVFQCDYCGGYFLQQDHHRGKEVKRVSHEGNLERTSRSKYY